jgi:hypothetical protein
MYFMPILDAPLAGVVKVLGWDYVIPKFPLYLIIFFRKLAKIICRHLGGTEAMRRGVPPKCPGFKATPSVFTIMSPRAKG